VDYLCYAQDSLSEFQESCSPDIWDFFPVILGTFIVAIICSLAEMLAYCFFLWFYFYEIKAEIKNMLKYTCNSFKKFILF
jgi:hypothetical protein